MWTESRRGWLVGAVLLALGVGARAALARPPLLRTPEMRDVWQPTPMTVVAISRDGQTVAASKPDADIFPLHLWQIGARPARENDSERTLPEPFGLERGSRFAEFAFSPDGSLLAGAGSEGGWHPWVALWDVGTGKLLWTHWGVQDDFSWGSLAWSPRGDMLATCGSAGGVDKLGRVYLWAVAPHVSEFHLVRTLALNHKGREIRQVAFAPDGGTVAGGDLDALTLWNVASGQIEKTLPNPTGSVRSLLFSPAGRTLLSQSTYDDESGHFSGKVQLWDVATGASRLLTAKPVGPPAFSPDGKLIAAGSCQLWDAATGTLLGGIGSPDGAAATAFAPDGQTIISGGDGVVLWDVAKLRRLAGRVLPRLIMGAPGVTEVPDAKVETVPNYGFEVQTETVLPPGARTVEQSVNISMLWDVRAHKAVAPVYHPQHPWVLDWSAVRRATDSGVDPTYAVSPGGKLMATSAWQSSIGNGLIYLWQVRPLKLWRQLRVPGTAPGFLLFSPDGRQLAAACRDARVRLWDVNSGELQQRWPGFMPSDNGMPVLAFSHDSRWLAALGEASGTINFWDTATGQRARVLQTPGAPSVESLAFSPDGQAFATGGNPARLWDLRTGRVRRTFTVYGAPSESMPQAPGQDAAPVAFAPDGDALLVASFDGSTYRWNVSWLRQPFHDAALRTLANPCGAQGGVADSEGHLRPHLSFAPDGRTLAAVGDDARREWEVASGRLRRTRPVRWLGAHVAGPIAGSYNAGSDRSDGDLNLWEARTGRVLRTLAKGPVTLTAIACAPDGHSVVAGLGDSVRLWDVPVGAERNLAPAGDAWFDAVAVSPDGRVVAGASAYGFIHLWDARSGALLRTLSGPTGAVTCLAFSPDSARLATGSEDYTVRLWDVASGCELRLWEGHAGTVTAVAFAPDGMTLASQSQDNTVKLWRVGR